MDDSKSLYTSHSKSTLRRQYPAVILNSVLPSCQPILFLAEHLHSTASTLTRNQIILYDRQGEYVPPAPLCGLPLRPQKQSGMATCVGAVFSKAWCKSSFQSHAPV